MLGKNNHQYLPALELYRTRNWLFNKYWIEGLSLSSIASIVGVNLSTIKKWMNKVGIERRKDGSRTGKFHHSFKGFSINSQGYKLIYCPDHPKADKRKYVREHVLEAEKILGRFLLPFEVIHHINGNRLDNTLQNLYLLPKREHDRYEQLRRKKSIHFIPITHSNLSMNE